MALMTAGVRTFPCSVESGDPASIAAAITTIKRQNIYNILGEYLLELQIREVMMGEGKEVASVNLFSLTVEPGHYVTKYCGARPPCSRLAQAVIG